MITRNLVAFAGLLLAVSVESQAQNTHKSLLCVHRSERFVSIDAQPEDEPAAPDWVMPVSSMLVPGAGQLLSGRDRGVLYLAAEAFLMLRFVALDTEGRRERDTFRDLAFSVARAPFRPARRDTVFEYFEAMQSYLESGPFNAGTGDELVPPIDETTYNGHLWRLARQTFLSSPDEPPDKTSEEYESALDFYTSRAVGANFQWSWRNAGLERDLFRQSIRRSDDAFRMATQYLGLVLMNHLVSAIDAFVTQRMGRHTGLQSSIVVVPQRRSGVAASLALRLEF